VFSRATVERVDQLAREAPDLVAKVAAGETSVEGRAERLLSSAAVSRGTLAGETF